MPPSDKYNQLVASLEAMLDFTKNAHASTIYETNKCLEFIQSCLARGVNANIVLRSAIFYKNIEIVKIALQYEVTYNFIEQALRVSSLEIAQYLISVIIKRHASGQPYLITGDEICLSIKLNYDLAQMFGEYIKILTNEERSSVVAKCLYLKAAREKTYPLVEACIENGVYFEHPSKPFNPLNIAMQLDHPAMLQRLLHAGGLAFLYFNLDDDSILNTLVSAGSDATIHLLISELWVYLDKELSAEPSKLSKARCQLRHPLSLALDKAACTAGNNELINYYLSLGAIPTPSTLNNLLTHYGWDYFFTIFKSLEHPQLTEIIISQSLKDRSVNLYKAFRPYIRNTDIQTLTAIITQLLDFFICYVRNTPLSERDIETTQVIPFMKACFHQGVDINMLHNDLSASNNAKHAWKLSIAPNRFYTDEVPNKKMSMPPSRVTFLHAAMIANSKPLITLLLESDARTDIRMQCRSLDNNTDVDFGPATHALGDAHSRLDFHQTLTTRVIPQQEMRVIIFNILQSTSQTKSAKDQAPYFSMLSADIMLRLISYLIPDDEEFNYTLSSYKNIFHNNKHFFFNNETKHAEIPQQLLLDTIKTPITRS